MHFPCLLQSFMSGSRRRSLVRYKLQSRRLVAWAPFDSGREMGESVVAAFCGAFLPSFLHSFSQSVSHSLIEHSRIETFFLLRVSPATKHALFLRRRSGKFRMGVVRRPSPLLIYFVS